MELRIGFLASDNGSSARAIIDEIDKGNLDAQYRAIISNNPEAPILKFAMQKEIHSKS